MMSIVQHIREIYPSLSPSKKKVASYILNNFPKVHLETVLDLSDKIGVSDTTIINFCSEIGYYGYSDFKRAVRNELASAEFSYPVVTSDQKALNDLIQATINECSASIKETLLDNENLRAFSEAESLLADASKIYVIGFYHHAAEAKALVLNLIHQGYDSEAIIPDLGDYIDHLMMLQKGSVAIVYDFSLYTTALTEICTILQEKAIPIILITDDGPCPRLSQATVAIHCHGFSENAALLGKGFVACKTVSLVLYNLLCTVSPREKGQYSSNLRQGIFTRFNPYGVIESTPDKDRI